MTDRYTEWQTNRDAQDRTIRGWARAMARQQGITNALKDAGRKEAK